MVTNRDIDKDSANSKAIQILHLEDLWLIEYNRLEKILIGG